MKSLLIAIVLSATTAFAAATWVYKADRSLSEPTNSPEDTAVSFNAGLPASERIAALELAVSQERFARQLLQEEIIVLMEDLEGLQGVAIPTAVTSTEESGQRRSDMSREERRERFAQRNSPEARTERLISAGIDPGTAGWILQREEALQMESLQARFEADRTGSQAEYYRDRVRSSDVLREELGDADFERYLQANDRPVSVGISSVIGSSPAQLAGLQSGDEIVRYDGERVFSMTDISQAARTGDPGQNVVMDIVRDGVPMQVVIARGPLGVTGGRRRR